MAVYKVSGLVLGARRWQVIRVFPGTRFFSSFGVSPSSETGGWILSGFHGFLECTLVEFVNFGMYTGSMLGLEFGIGVILRVFPFLFSVRRKSRISISLNDKVIKEVRKRRGLVKRSRARPCPGPSWSLP